MNGVYISTDFGVNWNYRIFKETSCSKIFIRHPYIIAADQKVYLLRIMDQHGLLSLIIKMIHGFSVMH